MPVKVFRGGVCEHRHEFAQIKEIYSLLTDFYKDQTIFMITNLRVNNGEIDCLLLRPDGPIILELKAYQGKIYGLENDRFWHVITAGGKKVDLDCNLFTKLKYYRFDMMDKLKRRLTSIIPDLEESKKLGNIAGWGYFEKNSVYPSDQVNMRVAKWFNVVTAENFIEQLEISKSGYFLYEKDLQSIVDDLHVEPYTISPSVDKTIKQKVEENPHEDVMAEKSRKSKVLAVPIQPVKRPMKKPQRPVKDLVNFDRIWDNILQNSGNTFVSKEGFEFTYSIDQANLLPSLQGWDEIPRADFEMAHAFGACGSPECYGNLFLGKKVIWAILHDERINL